MILFDRNKRADTLRLRGLDMADCADIWDGPHLTFEDDRHDYGETRLITLGYMQGRLVFVA